VTKVDADDRTCVPSRRHQAEDKERFMADTGTDLLDPNVQEVSADGDGGPADDQAGDVIAADLLVEEISIDGMCGVY
jgi:mycofactocin precursor